MPLVSVVITARNARRYIGKTLDSILAQTYRDFEVIVVDGGSSDDTLEVVSHYAGPVRVIAGSSLTKSAGRNVGIRAASGEFIALVDADDWWETSKLARQLEFVRHHPTCQWVYSDCFIFDERRGCVANIWSTGNRLASGPVLEPLLFNCFVPSPTPVIRRDVFDVVGMYDESFARHEPEDWDMWLRIAARFPVGVVPEPLAYLRVHPASLMAKEDLRLAAEGALAVVERAFARNPALTSGLPTEVRAHWYRRFGRGMVRGGRARDARTFFARAARAQPFRPDTYTWWMGTWLPQTAWAPLRRMWRLSGRT